jgi:hypothetical protein
LSLSSRCTRQARSRRCFRPSSSRARLKLKLKKNWTGGASQRQRYNTITLKDNKKKEEFKVTLTNKFQVIEELLEEETIEEKWQKVKEAVTSTCQEVLGPKSYTHKNTLKQIESSNEASEQTSGTT